MKLEVTLINDVEGKLEEQPAPEDKNQATMDILDGKMVVRVYDIGD